MALPKIKVLMGYINEPSFNTYEEEPSLTRGLSNNVTTIPIIPNYITRDTATGLLYLDDIFNRSFSHTIKKPLPVKEGKTFCLGCRKKLSEGNFCPVCLPYHNELTI